MNWEHQCSSCLNADLDKYTAAVPANDAADADAVAVVVAVTVGLIRFYKALRRLIGTYNLVRPAL